MHQKSNGDDVAEQTAEKKERYFDKLLSQLQKILSVERTEVRVPVDKIVPSESNPRKNFDTKLIAGLSKSMHGGRQAIAVILRPLTDVEKEQYPGKEFMIIAGERRWRGAKRGNISELRALIYEETLNEHIHLLLSAMENVGREQLSFLDEASLSIRFRDELGMKPLEVAEFQGKKSELWALQRLSVGRLPPEVQDTLNPEEVDRTLPIAAAYAIAGYSDPEFQIFAARKILAEDIPATRAVAFIRKLARKENMRSMREGKTRGKPDDMRRAVRSLINKVFDGLERIKDQFPEETYGKAFVYSDERETVQSNLHKAARRLDELAAKFDRD